MGSTLPATNLPEPPNPPKEPNVDGKSVTQAAAIAAIQQKYNNAKAAYPGKIRQYNNFLPLKAHITQAESLIFYIASRLMIEINHARDWNEPIDIKKQSYNHYLHNFNSFKQKVNHGVCATWQASKNVSLPLQHWKILCWITFA